MSEKLGSNKGRNLEVRAEPEMMVPGSLGRAATHFFDEGEYLDRGAEVDESRPYDEKRIAEIEGSVANRSQQRGEENE